MSLTEQSSQSSATAQLPALPFTGPWLLAPMQGVTEPCFRDLVLARNNSKALGGAFTEFMRVVDRPVAAHVLRDQLGPQRFEAPVGLQLMGSNLEALAETAALAVEVGAPILDLNFGCPAKGAIRGCAGSAILKDPGQLERVVRTCVEAVPGTPVSAKIRAGYDDDLLLEELSRAAEAGGAALLTVHCRTRLEGYRDTEDWNRLARAVQSISIPVCGNGGIWKHADLQRLLDETGCEFAMVGRAALADPWIFTGRSVTQREAAEFLLEYAVNLANRNKMQSTGIAGRLKQLLRTWTAGSLIPEQERTLWLREKQPLEIFQRLASAADCPVPSQLTT